MGEEVGEKNQIKQLKKHIKFLKKLIIIHFVNVETNPRLG